MVNSLSCQSLWLCIVLWNIQGISLLPLASDVGNGTLTKSASANQPYQQGEQILKRNDESNNDLISKNITDLLAGATDLKSSQFHLPLAAKPRGFNLPKERNEQHKANPKTEAAAQNYYSSFYSDLPPLGHAQPYYSLAENPIIAKFLSQHSKQFQTRQQSFANYDASILGSGDFGILRGGTFYSGEEQTYLNEEGSDFYYGDASNTQAVSSTEGFIQKYTYPEEQFAQFKDFADLGTPEDSAFSQYVVVYAAKNATGSPHNSKPKNIFEQLQEIDKEKALEQRKRRKHSMSSRSSITKLKLVKTKHVEKKWAQKQTVKIVDDDPLIALS